MSVVVVPLVVCVVVSLVVSFVLIFTGIQPIGSGSDAVAKISDVLKQPL